MLRFLKIKGSRNANGFKVWAIQNFFTGDITMKTTANILDLSTLPDTARREVADFYQFVMQRYGRIQKKQAVIKNKLPAEFYKPIAVSQYQAVSRDEIYCEI